VRKRAARFHGSADARALVLKEGTMKPIGPLMWEHRIIEKMIDVLKREITTITEKNTVNVILIDQAADFFRTYADRTHHGKEEDILFRDLAKKMLSQDHKRIMDELVAEHVTARKMVGNLMEAKERYLAGVKDGAEGVVACLTALIGFYPGHIEKEDKHFFFPCLDYLGTEEQERMLQEFYEFDRNMIHEKYTGVVERFLGQAIAKPPSGKR
jgi:hemerythrin-like domain-containing protein